MNLIDFIYYFKFYDLLDLTISPFAGRKMEKIWNRKIAFEVKAVWRLFGHQTVANRRKGNLKFCLFFSGCPLSNVAVCSTRKTNLSKVVKDLKNYQSTSKV